MTEERPQSYTYVGVEPCGCITGAVVDNPAHKKDVAKELGKWVRWGMSVERMTTEAFRTDKRPLGCRHRKAKKEAR